MVKKKIEKVETFRRRYRNFF